MNVEFYRHHLTQQDKDEVATVLASTFLTTGPVTAAFEQAFAGYTGLAHVVGVNSCTAALHLSLLALGIGPGHEVITTPLTFIASATAIMHAGATPVFVDVEKDTGLLDVRRIAAAVTPRTRAILPVHLYGAMVDMTALRQVADHHGLKIVEDCAHCIEGRRDGVRPGALADAACYSFYATKNLTCGEGGAIATGSGELADRLRVLRTHGMNKDAAGRYSGLYRHWDMVALGWKYNLHDVSAALLIHQIPRLEANWRRRHAIAALYDQGLAGVAGLSRPRVFGRSAHHLYTIWVAPEHRDAVLHGLQQKGVGVAVNYRAIHTLTYFRERFGFAPEDFPNALAIGNRTLSLPFYSRLTDEAVGYVVDSLKQVMGECTRTKGSSPSDFLVKKE
jgi:dTDP-4-amino-4,6-dideoxygalactose transaminase